MHKHRKSLLNLKLAYSSCWDVLVHDFTLLTLAPWVAPCAKVWFFHHSGLDFELVLVRVEILDEMRRLHLATVPDVYGILEQLPADWWLSSWCLVGAVGSGGDPSLPRSLGGRLTRPRVCLGSSCIPQVVKFEFDSLTLDFSTVSFFQKPCKSKSSNKCEDSNRLAK